MPIQREYITPDSIRDKELDDLRVNLRRAKRTNWFLFCLGLILGATISWALTALWG